MPTIFAELLARGVDAIVLGGNRWLHDAALNATRTVERSQKAKEGSTVAKLEEEVAMAKRLRRANPVTVRRRSLSKIAEELADAGYLNERTRAYNAMSI